MNRWRQYKRSEINLQAKSSTTILVTEETIMPFRKFDQRLDGVVAYIDGPEQWANDKVWILPDNVEVLLQKRIELRQNKQYKEADAVRDQLNELGIVVRDGKDWYPKKFEETLRANERFMAWLYPLILSLNNELNRRYEHNYDLFVADHNKELSDWKKF